MESKRVWVIGTQEMRTCSRWDHQAAHMHTQLGHRGTPVNIGQERWWLLQTKRWVIFGQIRSESHLFNKVIMKAPGAYTTPGGEVLYIVFDDGCNASLSEQTCYGMFSILNNAFRTYSDWTCGSFLSRFTDPLMREFHLISLWYLSYGMSTSLFMVECFYL